MALVATHRGVGLGGKRLELEIVESPLIGGAAKAQPIPIAVKRHGAVFRSMISEPAIPVSFARLGCGVFDY
jgi:hypothetical protein